MAVHSFSAGADRLGLKLSAADHSSPSPLDDSDTENEEDTMNLYGPKQLADSTRTVRKNTALRTFLATISPQESLVPP